MKILVVGAGVTGCYTASKLAEKGLPVSLYARGARAEGLAAAGLRMRDGISGEERRVHLDLRSGPVSEEFDLTMVCVQAIHRPALLPLLAGLPGRPTIWFLGNTAAGFEAEAAQLGRHRVLGGFPGVGGTWDGDLLVYADRRRPQDPPFDTLVLGEAYPQASPAAARVAAELTSTGMKIERYSPIMDWHLSHLALILPLAELFYSCNSSVEAAAADRAALKECMRAIRGSFTALKRSGHTILPPRLNLFRYIPAGLGARKLAALITSDFGRIALAGHAATAKAEMQNLHAGFDSAVRSAKR